MNDIKAGMIFTTQFCSADSDAFTGYIDYIDRDEATRKDNLSKYTLSKGYLDSYQTRKKPQDSQRIDGIDKRRNKIEKACRRQGNRSLM